jgi:hypothetical protein
VDAFLWRSERSLTLQIANIAQQEDETTPNYLIMPKTASSLGSLARHGEFWDHNRTHVG